MGKKTKILAILMLSLMFVYTTGCDNNNEKKSDNTVNGTKNEAVAETVEQTTGETLDERAIDYVDLGLPSGILWATCNIGANAPEEYGDYFAWGETEVKSVYAWSTYIFCADGERGQLTKYCPYDFEGYNGFVDTLKVLRPEDDAASVLMANGCRMPAKEEFKELFRNTDREWTTLNGVDGYLLTARNGSGKNIFIPAAGYSLDGELLAVGNGYLWSSTLFDGLDFFYDDPNLAWCLLFSSSDWSVDGTQRCVGMPIRPVRSSQ